MNLNRLPSGYSKRFSQSRIIIRVPTNEPLPQTQSTSIRFAFCLVCSSRFRSRFLLSALNVLVQKLHSTSRSEAVDTDFNCCSASNVLKRERASERERERVWTKADSTARRMRGTRSEIGSTSTGPLRGRKISLLSLSFSLSLSRSLSLLATNVCCERYLAENLWSSLKVDVTTRHDTDNALRAILESAKIESLISTPTSLQFSTGSEKIRNSNIKAEFVVNDEIR